MYQGTRDVPTETVFGRVMVLDSAQNVIVAGGHAGKLLILKYPRQIPINADGVVDMSDVKVFVAVLLGTDTDPIRVAASDLNSDGGADGLGIQPFVGVFIS